MLVKILKSFIPMAKTLPTVAETTRRILYQSHDVAVICFRWKKGDGLPVHHHYGKCIFQVLDGKLIEQRGQLQTVMYRNDIGKIEKGYSHSIEPITENALSLHIYSPPPTYLIPKK